MAPNDNFTNATAITVRTLTTNATTRGITGTLANRNTQANGPAAPSGGDGRACTAG